MFLLNSRLGLFSAATSLWHPFSRSYGVILPSSLTRVLSFVLGFSPHLPVSVCGTGTFILSSSFSRQREIVNFDTYFLSPSHTIISITYFTIMPDSVLSRSLSSKRFDYPSVSLLQSNKCRWYWNLNQLSIAYDLTSSA